MNILEKVERTVLRFSMFREGETVLTGLSGGPDSVCLLHMLMAMKRGPRVYALYVDHGLRPDETPEEIAFCRDLCERLGIRFRVEGVPMSHEKYLKNRQALLREERYRLYERAAAETGATRIALGHTKDDQAETVLMNLLRGSGPAGLSGIPPVRGHIVRPLIEVTRQEIESHLAQKGTDFVVDSSNLKEEYQRNRVRLSLMPAIGKYNPNIIDTLARTADIMREENDFLELTVTKKLMKLVSRKSETRIELFLFPLQTLEKVILRRILMRSIESVRGLRGIRYIHVEDIIELIKNAEAGSRLYLPGGIRVIKGYSTLVLTSEEPVKIAAYSLDVPGRAVITETGLMIEASYTDGPFTPEGRDQICIDAALIETSLTVRGRQSGDHFYPLGFGKRKKVKRYFIDEKVPRDERDSIPLVFSGSDLLWIAGHRSDERFKTTKKTRKCVKLELIRLRT